MSILAGRVIIVIRGRSGEWSNLLRGAGRRGRESRGGGYWRPPAI